MQWLNLLIFHDAAYPACTVEFCQGLFQDLSCICTSALIFCAEKHGHTVPLSIYIVPDENKYFAKTFHKRNASIPEFASYFMICSGFEGVLYFTISSLDFGTSICTASGTHSICTGSGPKRSLSKSRLNILSSSFSMSTAFVLKYLIPGWSIAFP